jgi:hypothetical protein
MDQIAARTVGEIAQAIDLAPDAWIGSKDRLAQRLPFDEIFRELIERTIECGVEPRLTRIDADKDFASIERIESKAGALADLDPGALERRKPARETLRRISRHPSAA